MANFFGSAGSNLTGGLIDLYGTAPTDTAIAETNAPDCVSQTLTGNLAITYSSGVKTVYFLDPGGADRTVTPNAGYPSKYEIVIINTGDELITFDPSGCAKVVEPYSESQSFFFDGSVWG